MEVLLGFEDHSNAIFSAHSLYLATGIAPAPEGIGQAALVVIEADVTTWVAQRKER